MIYNQFCFQNGAFKWPKSLKFPGGGVSKGVAWGLDWGVGEGEMIRLNFRYYTQSLNHSCY